MDWAGGLDVDGHKDFTLPTRAEQAILFGTIGDQFHRDGYWSREQLAAYPVESHGFVEPTSWTDEYTRIFKLFEKEIGR